MKNLPPPALSLLLILSVFAAACNTAPPAATTTTTPAAVFPSGAVVDLSHAYDEQTVYWPTAEQTFVLKKDAEGMTDKGYFYAANSFSTAEHGGTHLDAPVHFAAGKNTADRIPLEQLMGAAALVDVSAQCERDADYQISQRDIEDWERANGELPRGVILLLRTGFGKRWPDRKSYMGTDERGAAAVPKLHFPGLHPDAARWLVANRQVKAVGLDTPSIDHGQSTDFQTHRVLFERDIPAFENLANLDKLPLKNFHVIALPMKIKGGTGGPLRAVAIIHKD